MTFVGSGGGDDDDDEVAVLVVVMNEFDVEPVVKMVEDGFEVPSSGDCPLIRDEVVAIVIDHTKTHSVVKTQMKFVFIFFFFCACVFGCWLDEDTPLCLILVWWNQLRISNNNNNNQTNKKHKIKKKKKWEI